MSIGSYGLSAIGPCMCGALDCIAESRGYMTRDEMIEYAREQIAAYRAQQNPNHSTT